MGNSAVNKLVFSFHMPLFFVIIGYFLPQKQNSKEVLKRRISQLFPPYIFSCLFVTLYYQLKIMINIFFQHKTINDFVSVSLKWLYASLYGAGTEHQTPLFIPSIGAVWFLLATVSCSYITKKALELKFPSIIIALIAIIGVISSKIFWLPLSIQCGMAASVFVYFGVILKNNRFLDKTFMLQIRYIIPAFIIWLYEICGTDSWFDIAQNQYPNGAFDFIAGGCASVCIIWALKGISQKLIEFKVGTFLEWLGKHSLIILCFHFIELKTIPWMTILRIFGITNQLFMPILFLKVLWCIMWTIIVDHTILKKVFY